MWSLLLPLFVQTSGAIELVESWPRETALDQADLRDTAGVWLEMIDGARVSLHLAQFYASDVPGSRLSPVIEAIERAALRGVEVRFLAEASFAKTYPETLARLERALGAQVRRLDLRSRTRGILHAKFFVVDGRELFVGSQNFDWRSLEHIQELGLRVESRELAAAFEQVFALDWAAAAPEGAGAAPSTPRAQERAGPARAPVTIGDGETATRITAVFSPEGWLPEGAEWDLPRIVGAIDSARTRVRVQLLSYGTLGRDRTYFDELDRALRRAAARGVAVEMLLADWSKRAGTIESLQSLQVLSNVSVRMLTVPQAASGFVPFARVIHAKYLVVDGERAWLGTSNWERDYFYASRNAGLMLEGGAIPRRLDDFFVTSWSSPHAYEIDPAAKYAPPRIGE